MGRTRVINNGVITTSARGAATHYLKFNIGATGAVTAGTVKCGGGMLVQSVVRAAEGRYTVTLNPQHILGVAKIVPNLFTPAQTDYFVTPRIKAQGTDGIALASGVQSFEIMCSAVVTASGGTTVAASAADPADPVTGSTMFVEITEYTSEAANEYTVA
jgi:hypothetical protein